MNQNYLINNLKTPLCLNKAIIIGRKDLRKFKTVPITKLQTRKAIVQPAAKPLSRIFSVKHILFNQ